MDMNGDFRHTSIWCCIISSNVSGSNAHHGVTISLFWTISLIVIHD